MKIATINDRLYIGLNILFITIVIIIFLHWRICNISYIYKYKTDTKTNIISFIYNAFLIELHITR